MLFTSGQRWVSDTESELGLGIVTGLDRRRVTIVFPATGDERCYAMNDAPVSRVIFKPGDVITSHEGWKLTVVTILQDNGIYIYKGIRTDTAEADISLSEALLDGRLTFSRPQDRLFAGQIDSKESFAWRLRARRYQSEQLRLQFSGLRGMRASLIPHQLFIAYEVGQRYAPRVLLADEVGLGKTIEAGMVVHQQLLAGRAERVLIVVPESLQHQWLVEMLRRFNLLFSLFDDSRYVEALQDSTNPFVTEQWVICSLEFVCQDPRRLTQLAEAQWDLLVVDEAHHLSWSQGAPGHEYQAIEALARQIPGVLLLTATPEQCGLQSHFSRLRLLDPGRFHHYEVFVAEQQKYHAVADAVTVLLGEQCLSTEQCYQLRQLLDAPDAEPLLQAVNDINQTTTDSRQKLIHMLLDRHGTSRVLFRNTRHGVKGFPCRRLHPIKLPLPIQYQVAALPVVDALADQNTLKIQVGYGLCPERGYKQPDGQNTAWWHFDPRVTWLLGWLMENADEKVLVICAHATTALQLAQVLREREAIRVAVFHEGLSLMERDRAAAWFATQEMGAQVLLCSETGSEGRNFQFSCQLIMFDLPENPDLLEQRIGRLDRIGQKHDIHIWVPYLAETAQEVLLRWYHEGLNAFEKTCPAGRTLYEANQPALMRYLSGGSNHHDLDNFIRDSRQQYEYLKLQLEQGRDRLLEIHSSGGEQGQQLAQAIAEQDNCPALTDFALNLFDIIGINQEDLSDHLLLLTPSDHMSVPDFPGLPQDGCIITFDRNCALSREDVQFMSWEHPIMRNGMDLILSGGTGNCAAALLKNKALAPGTLLVELVYVVEAQSPRHLQLTRFLPPMPVRMLMDERGHDWAEQVAFDSFNSQLQPINAAMSSRLVSAVRHKVQEVLVQAEVLVEQRAQQLIETARDDANEKLSAELARLLALKRVNSGIRDDEIQTLQHNHRQILIHLQQAGWRLDAIRLVVVAH